jgi:hypothetical protein
MTQQSSFTIPPPPTSTSSYSSFSIAPPPSKNAQIGSLNSLAGMQNRQKESSSQGEKSGLNKYDSLL